MYINIHKMEKSSLTSPKAGTLNRVFKVNITTKWSKYNHETPDRIQEKEHSLVYVIFLSLEASKTQKNNSRLRKSSRIKETKKT